MNNLRITTIVGWETRNWRKTHRAQVWCKNYGLAPLLKNVFVGKLYLREKEVMAKRLEKLFVKKTDLVFIASLCRSCHTNLAPAIQEKAKDLANFEIVTEK